MRCTRCTKDAVYEARYNGEMLCADHFIYSVEKRIRREIREQVDFSNSKLTIAVAISGGKDSSVTLYSLANAFSGRQNVELKAFTIDEGIEGYRSSGLDSARRLSESLGIPHSVLSFEEAFGVTMDQFVRDDPASIPCSRCGPFRRRLMNMESLKLKADYVALGINLDDYAQSILMNVARGDVDRMARMAPHHDEKDGLVRRILPLRKVPEKEVLLYAMLKGIDFDSSWCPYYAKAQRNTFREMIETLEERSPGSKFAIVKFLDGVRPALSNSLPQERLRKCEICGEPTSREICANCQMLGD